MVSGAVLVTAYLVGAIPCSNIVAHVAARADLRRFGTGTVSGSNLYRLAGFPALAVGGLADIAKGAMGPGLAVGLDQPTAVAVLAGGLAVTGHNWSVFLRWAGGRGISPGMGAGLVLAWPATLVLALGLAIGRLVHATALGSFVAQLLLTPVLWITEGPSGAAVGVALAIPMLVKRLMGNSAPEQWSSATVVSRLMFDRDPTAATGSDGSRA